MQGKGYEDTNKKLVHTSPATFSVVKKSSFGPPSNPQNDNRSNRAQTLWKMSQHVIVSDPVTTDKVWDGKKATIAERQQVLETWSLVTSTYPDFGFNLQRLYLSEDGSTFSQYDSVGTILATGTLDQLIQDVKQHRVAIQTNAKNEPLQIIYYGAPGTGKSKAIKKGLQNESKDRVFRTTFHPDSDYASFVGCYKPAMEERTKYGLQGQPIKVNGQDLKEGIIVYRFGPQVFLKAYAKAWEEYAKDDPEPVCLVIEEINRGNCAQIFGDLFQLLDRNEETGCSEYPIVSDDDLRDHLAKKIFNTTKTSVSKGRKDAIDALLDEATDGKATLDDVFTGEMLVLPPNLYIWATMNTSDQSLFPIDSAFKRRWDWKYVPICEPDKNEDGTPWTKWKIEIDAHRYDWWTFLGKINGLIGAVTESEDKKLGYFFAKAKGGVISAEMFVAKIAFYLWHDVFKDYGFERDEFQGGSGEKKEILFTDFFEADGAPKKATIIRFLDNLKVPDESLNATPPAAPSPGAVPTAGSVNAVSASAATQPPSTTATVPGGTTTPLPPTPVPVPVAP